MKYFKKVNDEQSEKKPHFGRNDGELWNRIVKLFAREGDYNKQQFTTGIEDLANGRREFARQKEQEEAIRAYLRKKPTLEDNSDDSNYGGSYEQN